MKNIEYLYLVILSILGVYSVFTIRRGVFVIKLYAVVTLLTETAGYLYLFNFNRPFALLYNIFSLFEIAIWLRFYFLITENTKRGLFRMIFGTYLLIFLYLGAFDLLSVNYTGFLLGNLFVTSLIVLYLYYILQKNLDLNGYFIIMVGALFYYCGGFLLIGMIKIIATIDSNAARELYSINAVLNIFFYGFVLWGLIRKDRETKIPLSEPHRPFA